MTNLPPYNPLDKINLAESVAQRLLYEPARTLPPADAFRGAGVYAIYYSGEFELYSPIVSSKKDGTIDVPIYVGKAVPKGSRKGGGLEADLSGSELNNRLYEHAVSIIAASNLNVFDFTYRKLVVDDIWIPLGESLLIHRFKPVWNLVIEGFGNHDPGMGRSAGRKPAWDVLHPGRPWANKLTNGPPIESIIAKVHRHFGLE